MQDLARATIDTQNCGFCVSIFFGTATLIAHRVGGGSLQLRSGACDPKLPQVAGMRITAMQRVLSVEADQRNHGLGNIPVIQTRRRRVRSAAVR